MGYKHGFQSSSQAGVKPQHASVLLTQQKGQRANEGAIKPSKSAVITKWQQRRYHTDTSLHKANEVTMLLDEYTLTL